MWKDFISFALRILKMPVHGAFGTARYAKSTILNTVTLGAILMLFIWAAVIVYAMFYYTYVPTLTHVRDVNLQFR